MTWTAGELVNQLRALDPSTPVYVCAEGDDLEEITAVRGPWWRRHSTRRVRNTTARPIVRTRVIVTDEDRFAYIEGAG